MKSNLFVQAAIAAVVFVVAGCDKEAEKVQLQTPVPEASVEATSVECTVSWANVENAVSYSWKLYETAEPTVAVAEAPPMSVISRNSQTLRKTLNMSSRSRPWPPRRQITSIPRRPR